MHKEQYDIIVVGAGHAGAEAALATARMGLSTVCITLRKDNIGVLSCNPAIGGVGKGQLVREVDALGGEMAKATDYAGIQFRMLNLSRGAAVHSSRAQIDRDLYKQYMRDVFDKEDNLTVREGAVSELLCENNEICGARLASGDEVYAAALIITPGTFLNGLIHVGLDHHAGGRIGEEAVSGLSQDLLSRGFRLMRFKTGTCARLDTRTIDYSGLEVQQGDAIPHPFSFTTRELSQKQLPCYITYTNPKTHAIIRDNLDRSPLYSGVITGTGVRYCPSIEDKIMRFGDRDRHHVFLEPEGYDSLEVYPNGVSTSLPADVQMDMLRSIKGLENVEATVLGYGIEHDVVDATQLSPTLESKKVHNLYFAGQINGTTGYEEAAAQGIVAGINAALKVQGKDPLIFDRSSSYIGVLIDDLVTKGTNEPYRMFTSRVEYRLLVREDNADIRLSKVGYDVGLLTKDRYEAVEIKKRQMHDTINYLRRHRIKATEENNAILKESGVAPLSIAVTGEELLRRPGMQIRLLERVGHMCFSVSQDVLEQVAIQVKYAGYIGRQLRDVKKYYDLEKILIPKDFVYANLSGLSREIQEKLQKIQPVSLGQASRISGVTPAAIMLLMVHIKKYWSEKKD